jgi:Flp pilus assembly protein TadD
MLGKNELAIAAARRAADSDPNNYAMREQLALALVAAKEFDEAEPHLRWCLTVKPEDRRLEEQYKQAIRQR